MTTCKTCEKRRKGTRCAVLKFQGAWGEFCSAWTDDPSWEKEVRVQVEIYREAKEWTQLNSIKTL